MKTLKLADVKAHLSALVTEIEAYHEQVTITRNGVPAAIVISLDEWESLQETIAVLSDEQAVRNLQEADDTVAAGETYGSDEVRAALAARRARGA